MHGTVHHRTSINMVHGTSITSSYIAITAQETVGNNKISLVHLVAITFLLDTLRNKSLWNTLNL